MNKKNIFFFGLLAIAIIALAKLSGDMRSPMIEPVLAPSSALTPQSEWFPAVHLGYNGALSWRFDPFFARLALLCPSPHEALYGLFLAFHILGIAALCLLVAPSVGLRSALVAGILAGALLLQIFSRDFFLFGAVVWWPWITLLVVQTSRLPFNRIFPFLVILFFFGLRTTKSGNVLAPFIIGFGVVLAGYLSMRGGRANRLAFLLGAIAAALPLLFVTRFDAGSPAFDYPPNARVVPIEGAFGFTRALVGPDRDFSVIDRALLDHGYSLLVVALLFFTAWGWILTRRDRPSRPAIGGVLMVTSALVVGAIWDTLAPSLSEISPLRSVGRLVPLLGFAPLVPVTVALAVPLLVITFTFAQRLTPLYALTLFILGASFSEKPLAWSWGAPPGSVHGLSNEKVATARRALQEGETNEIGKNLLSPSAGILLRDGFTAGYRAVTTEDRFVPAGPLIESIETSHGQERSGALVDRNRDTRWSAERGRQFGDEWIRIRFKRPLRLLGLELDPGSFVTDFPSGIEIVAPTDCSGNEGASILSIPRWMGPLRRTPQGYLYYGDERAVQIRFAETQTVQCLLIRQTADNRPVDWSVAELRVLTEK